MYVWLLAVALFWRACKQSVKRGTTNAISLASASMWKRDGLQHAIFNPSSYRSIVYTQLFCHFMYGEQFPLVINHRTLFLILSTKGLADLLVFSPFSKWNASIYWTAYILSS
jgi:hypothetical protein